MVTEIENTYNPEKYQVTENKYLYKSWKIIKTLSNSYECVRLRPVEWFKAYGLRAAFKHIDRIEANRAMGIIENPMDKKDRLHNFLLDKKLKREK